MDQTLHFELVTVHNVLCVCIHICIYLPFVQISFDWVLVVHSRSS